MIVINSEYDVVLTYSPIIEITGHLFECFDYYLFLKKYYKVAILLFGGLSLEQLKIAFESKYINSFNSIINDLILIDQAKLNEEKNKIIVFGKKTVVILCDGNIKSLDDKRIIFSTKKLYGFLCEYDNFHLVKINKNITYLMDYRIYGCKLKYFKSINYVKKLPFKYYRKCINQNLNRGMMYTTYICRMIDPQTILEYHQMSRCNSTILVVPFKKNEYDNLPGVKQIVAPVNDFFNKFDTYIYTPVCRKFDCSPRLLTECFILGKKVICDINYSDPGLQVRYNDCISNLNSLDLNENDQIIQVIKNELSK